jgi:hypothetical protein
VDNKGANNGCLAFQFRLWWFINVLEWPVLFC